LVAHLLTPLRNIALAYLFLRSILINLFVYIGSEVCKVGKIYTIYAANKAGTQVVVIPKGFEGYSIGAKVTWELVNGRLVLELCPLKPLGAVNGGIQPPAQESA